MRPSRFEYDLYSDLKAAGTFQLQGDKFYCGGTLHYSPNYLPTINIFLFHEMFKSRSLSEGMYIPCLYGFLEKNVLVTAINTRVDSSGGTINGTFLGHNIWITPQYLIIGKHVAPADEIIGVDIKINIWQEFRIRNVLINNKEVVFESNSVALPNNVEIVIRESANFSYLQSVKGFLGSFNEDDELLIRKIDDLIKKVEDEKQSQIDLHHKNNHEFYIRIKKKITADSIDELENICSAFCYFLTSITGHPVSPTAIDLILHESLPDGGKSEIRCSLISPQVITKEALDRSTPFKNVPAPITFEKIASEWEQRLRSFFKKYEELNEFLHVIKSNMLDLNDRFKITRTVDALKFCGKEKGKQYTEAVQNFAFEKLQNKLLDIFSAESLALVGKNISSVRNYIVHRTPSDKEAFDRAMVCPSFLNYIELLLYSYIQSKIGISDGLRQAYQEYWVSRFEQVRWVSFKPS